MFRSSDRDHQQRSRCRLMRGDLQPWPWKIQGTLKHPTSFPPFFFRFKYSNWAVLGEIGCGTTDRFFGRFKIRFRIRNVLTSSVLRDRPWLVPLRARPSILVSLCHGYEENCTLVELVLCCWYGRGESSGIPSGSILSAPITSSRPHSNIHAPGARVEFPEKGVDTLFETIHSVTGHLAAPILTCRCPAVSLHPQL